MKSSVAFPVVALVVSFLLGVSTVARADDDDGPPIAAPQRVFTQHGVTYVQLKADTQKAIGLKTKGLASAQYRPGRRAYGRVVAPGALLKGYHQLASASARLSQARARLAASHAEYRRLKRLYHQHHNVAEKQVQDARATWRSDQAAVTEAKARRTSAHGDLVAHWGNRITGWMQHNGAALKAVSTGQRRLLRLALPVDDDANAPPQHGRVMLADGSSVPVTLVSPAPGVETGLQGPAYYFQTASDVNRLSYGRQVTAWLESGPARRGVIVPDSAVVWSHGTAWVYVRSGPHRFRRRPVRTDIRTSGGWFQPSGLSPGTRIVVRGAQVLYSVQALAAGSHSADQGDGD